MKKWHHGHSIGVGFVIGLLVAQHVWTLILVCFFLGLMAGRLWNWLLMVEEAVRMKVFHQRKKPPAKKPPQFRPPSSQVGPRDPWPGEQF